MVLSKVGAWRHSFRQRLQFRDRTYIVPTKFGLAFATMALVVFMMAIGYSNNLIYIYVFFLISISFTSMYLTNENIKRLGVGPVSGRDLFAGEPSRVRLQLSNPSRSGSYDLTISLKSKTSVTKVDQVGAGETQWVSLETVFPTRGDYDQPVVELRSEFPFNILKAWKYSRKTAMDKIMIFPERKGSPQFPEGAEQKDGDAGLFREHRPYQSYDNPRRIDWKVFAKYQELLVKSQESQDRPTLSLDYENTLHLSDFEDRISQLSLWVSLAHEKGLSYSLKLGPWTQTLGSGESHFIQIMQKLARIKSSEVEL